jgi:hypothetical protein
VPDRQRTDGRGGVKAPWPASSMRYDHYGERTYSKKFEQAAGRRLVVFTAGLGSLSFRVHPERVQEILFPPVVPAGLWSPIAF